MTPEEFVDALRRKIVDENSASYREMFDTTAPESATDPYFKEALRFYRTLQADEKQVLFKIIRQVIVDTMSNVLGVLDTSSSLHVRLRTVELRIDGQEMTGDLQAIFLAAEEE